MRGFLWLGLMLLALCAALALRLPGLDQRPMHGDEANQAVRTGILLEQGEYHYDPGDHHGPLLYFSAWPLCRLTTAKFAETNEWNYRLVPVCYALTTLLLTIALGVGASGFFPNRAGLAVALLLTAISPAMVYYSRFFIQETLLVTFLTGMLLCAVRYVARRQDALADAPDQAPATTAAGGWWAAGFGACAGLAVATKETFVLSCAAIVPATLAACGLRRLRRYWSWRDLAIALGAGALMAALFFSSFMTHPRGVYDALFSTAQAYLTRATAVPEHQQPWNFYLKILFWFRYGRGPLWSEAGLLAPALIAVLAAFLPDRGGQGRGGQGRGSRWLRFTAVYTLTLTAIYSAIPYKTPWCVLSFLHGYILLAGAGAGLIWEWLGRSPLKLRLPGYAVVLSLLVWLGWRHLEQTHRACFKLAADPRNPFVYAHTGTDAMNMVRQIEEAAARAQGYDTLIAFAVPTPDTWPLPWYLRKYRNVGYWTKIDDIPAGFEPTILVAAADQGDLADERFGAGKRAAFFGVRPGVLVNLFLPELH